jgi:hypothetical protein
VSDDHLIFIQALGLTFVAQYDRKGTFICSSLCFVFVYFFFHEGHNFFFLSFKKADIPVHIIEIVFYVRVKNLPVIQYYRNVVNGSENSP